MSSVCNICLNQDKLITCPHCCDSACQSCYQRYFDMCLEDNKLPQCLHCKYTWQIEVIKSYFDRQYTMQVNDKIMMMLAYQREVNLLPSTQAFAERTRDEYIFNMRMANDRQATKEAILRTKDHKMKRRLNRALELMTDIPQLQINKKYFDFELIMPEDHGRTIYRDPNFMNTSTQSLTYTFKCSKVNCQGFIDQHNTCGLCKTVHCDKCFKVSHSNKCLADDIKSIKLIKSQCKSCPACKALIYRIDGCNHMYCTICKVHFDWLSGNVILKPRGDNPHAQEERLQNDDDSIDRMPIEMSDIHSALEHALQRYDEFIEEFHTEMRNCRAFYLLNMINKEQWKSYILKLEKIKDVYGNNVEYSATFSSVFKQLVRLYINKQINIEQLLEEIDNHLDELKQNIKNNLDYFDSTDDIISEMINRLDYCIHDYTSMANKMFATDLLYLPKDPDVDSFTWLLSKVKSVRLPENMTGIIVYIIVAIFGKAMFDQMKSKLLRISIQQNKLVRADMELIESSYLNYHYKVDNIMDIANGIISGSISAEVIQPLPLDLRTLMTDKQGKSLHSAEYMTLPKKCRRKIRTLTPEFHEVIMN